MIILIIDNGADPVEGGSNLPLRGGKATLWEGGIRGVSFVHSQLFNANVIGKINNELMHVSDWYPTLVKAAGGDITGLDLDGFDQWSTLRHVLNSFFYTLFTFNSYCSQFSDKVVRNIHYSMEGKYL